VRGGGAFSAVFLLDSAHEDYDDPWGDNSILGFRVAALAENPGGENCGDGICFGPENALNCSAECPDVCGDGVCTGTEGSTNCAADCGSVCGDGVCNGGESSATCVPDCGVVCGDGYCATGESCPEDCGPACGNGVLEGGEQCEVGVPLGDTCESLGFDSGDLSCNAATCQHDMSDCTNASCLPRRSRCSDDAECCSGNCRWGRCRGGLTLDPLAARARCPGARLPGTAGQDGTTQLCNRTASRLQLPCSTTAAASIGYPAPMSSTRSTRGRSLETFPLNVTLTPDGRYLLVTNDGWGNEEGERGLQVVDLETLTSTLVEVPHFFGLATTDEDVYLANGDDNLVEHLRFEGGALVRDPAPLATFPAGTYRRHWRSRPARIVSTSPA
jgi:hypothetical protein